MNRVFPFLDPNNPILNPNWTYAPNPIFNPRKHTICSYPAQRRAAAKRKNQRRHKAHLKNS